MQKVVVSGVCGTEYTWQEERGWEDGKRIVPAVGEAKRQKGFE